MDYQQSFPPVHQMIAGYFGIKPKNKTSEDKKQVIDEAMFELINTADASPKIKTKGIRML